MNNKELAIRTDELVEVYSSFTESLKLMDFNVTKEVLDAVNGAIKSGIDSNEIVQLIKTTYKLD